MVSPRARIQLGRVIAVWAILIFFANRYQMQTYLPLVLSSLIEKLTRTQVTPEVDAVWSCPAQPPHRWLYPCITNAGAAPMHTHCIGLSPSVGIPRAPAQAAEGEGQ